MASKITLLVDGKYASNQAESLLKEAKIPFKRVQGHGVNLPKAQYNHFSYNGMNGIQFLVKSIKK